MGAPFGGDLGKLAFAILVKSCPGLRKVNLLNSSAKTCCRTVRFDRGMPFRGGDLAKITWQCKSVEQTLWGRHCGVTWQCKSVEQTVWGRHSGLGVQKCRANSVKVSSKQCGGANRGSLGSAKVSSKECESVEQTEWGRHSGVTWESLRLPFW